jgi:hypothetical protein
MNERQKKVVCVGGIAVAAMCVYPPWQVRYAPFAYQSIHLGEQLLNLDYAPLWRSYNQKLWMVTRQ